MTSPYIDDKIDEIKSELTEIRETLDYIKETMEKADKGIANIGAQVMPTIEELKKSPFLKMLGVK